VLLHVIDASHPDWEEQREVVDEVLEELGLDEQDPQILVFNKIDRLTHAEEEATLRARSRARLAHVRVELGAGDGEGIAALYREAEVIERTSEGTRVRVEARVPDALKGWLSGRPDVTVEELPS
jgi:GTPase